MIDIKINRGLFLVFSAMGIMGALAMAIVLVIDKSWIGALMIVLFAIAFASRITDEN